MSEIRITKNKNTKTEALKHGTTVTVKTMKYRAANMHSNGVPAGSRASQSSHHQKVSLFSEDVMQNHLLQLLTFRTQLQSSALTLLWFCGSLWRVHVRNSTAIVRTCGAKSSVVRDRLVLMEAPDRPPRSKTAQFKHHDLASNMWG